MSDHRLIDGMGRVLGIGDVLNMTRVQTQVKWVITAIEDVPYRSAPGVQIVGAQPPRTVMLEAVANVKVQMEANTRTDILRYESADKLREPSDDGRSRVRPPEGHA